VANIQKDISLPGQSAEQIYQRVNEGIDQYLKQLPVEGSSLSKDEVKKQFLMESKMFTAKLVCLEEKISIEIKLGFLASAFRSKIESGLDHWLNKALDNNTSSKD